MERGIYKMALEGAKNPAGGDELEFDDLFGNDGFDLSGSDSETQVEEISIQRSAPVPINTSNEPVHFDVFSQSAPAELNLWELVQRSQDKAKMMGTVASPVRKQFPQEKPR